MIIRFKNGSNSLHLWCISQALIRFVKWTSFNSCGTQISSFFISPRLFICLWTVDVVIFIFSSILCTVTLWCNSIKALILSSSTSLGRTERSSSLSEKSSERNLIKQFRHCLSFKTLSPYKSHNFLATCSAFFPLRKYKVKYDEKALKIDAKETKLCELFSKAS